MHRILEQYNVQLGLAISKWFITAFADVLPVEVRAFASSDGCGCGGSLQAEDDYRKRFAFHPNESGI